MTTTNDINPRAIATDLIRSAARDIDTLAISEHLGEEHINDPGSQLTNDIDELIRTASITVGWPGDERNANIDRLVSIGDQLCEGTNHAACAPGLCGEAEATR